MLKKILFATDGSEIADNALNYLLDLAEKFSAEVEVIYSYEVPNELVRFFAKIDQGLSRKLADTEENLKSYGFDVTKETTRKLDSRGIRNKLKLEKGKPGVVIVDTAKAENCDLIVIGSRGLGQFGSFLLGSTSEYVLHHAECPVMVIH